jgi:hypothetical protein
MSLRRAPAARTRVGPARAPVTRTSVRPTAMRTYHSRSHRALSGGSIEIEGQWAGVQWTALALIPTLPLLARSPLGLGLLSVLAVCLFVFPARRRVVFDARRRALRLEHAGLFGEPGAEEIPFDQVRRVIFQPAGRKGGRPLFAIFARTGQGRVYLCTHAGERDTAVLDHEVRDLLAPGRE